MSLVDVLDLRVELERAEVDVVADVSFSIEPGEILGLVGESGSGKTTVGVALLGHAREGAQITRGSITVSGTSVLTLPPDRLRLIRGKLVSYVPQDPSSALNPALRIGTQLFEVIEVHETGLSSRAVGQRVESALADVALPSDSAFLKRFPHQLSGGQQQRVCIAMAFLLEPSLVVLDEPTTGLDVVTQAHVLTTVRSLCDRYRAAALYVTHDLAVVADIADRVLVMYAGRVVESAAASELFAMPAHPYTQKLLEAIPDVRARHALAIIPGRAPAPGMRPAGCSFEPRCSHAQPECRASVPRRVDIGNGHLVACRRVTELPYTVNERRLSPRVSVTSSDNVLAVLDVSARHGKRRVVKSVSFELLPRECLALVGESGSGKTTLARTVVGLHATYEGEVRLDGTLIAPAARNRSADARRRIQYIFQSPRNAMNPRRTVGDAIGVPIRLFQSGSRATVEDRVASALERVSLAPELAARFPDELSGGERQRVSIARALVCEPAVLICDEITSALDVSVQASIIELLRELSETQDLAMLFVTHNLALVRTVADRITVMRDGSIVESGPTEEILNAPQHPYTQMLIVSTPALGGRGSRAEALDPQPPGAVTY